MPDLLINAAGAAHPGYVQETSLEIYHEMMDLNYFGTVHMVQGRAARHAAAWQRIYRELLFGRGISGTLRLCGLRALRSIAVRGFSDILRLELKPLGMRVSVVFPPDTDTPGMDERKQDQALRDAGGIQQPRCCPAETVAKGVLRGMQRGQYVILPGCEISL